MTAIQSTAARTHLGTLTRQQVEILARAKAKSVTLANATRDAEQAYRDLLNMVMPEGANAFDEDTMSFYYVAPVVDPVGEASAPSSDTKED